MSADLYAVEEAAGGDMTVRDIPAAGDDRKTSRTFNLDEFSRTLIAVVQMVGDGLVLTTLSYASLRFVTYIEDHETGYLFNFAYFASTVGTSIIMICGFARSGVYDLFEEFKRIRIFRTVKCLLEVILLLTACLFIFKISDNVSRLWLGIWSITSGIALCGFRLLTASGVNRLKQSGRLAKNIAVVGAGEIG